MASQKFDHWDKLVIHREDGGEVEVFNPGWLKAPLTGDIGMYYRQLAVQTDLANAQHRTNTLLAALLQELQQQRVRQAG